MTIYAGEWNGAVKRPRMATCAQKGGTHRKPTGEFLSVRRLCSGSKIKTIQQGSKLKGCCRTIRSLATSLQIFKGLEEIRSGNVWDPRHTVLTQLCVLCSETYHIARRPCAPLSLGRRAAEPGLESGARRVARNSLISWAVQAAEPGLESGARRVARYSLISWAVRLIERPNQVWCA